jgi:hypothetical protein
MSRNTARARTGQEERRRAAETGEDAPAIPFLRRFTVFNTDQCDGLPRDIAKAAPPPPSMIEREAERLIAATAADFRIGGARAFYSPSGDFVQVPPPSRSTGTARPSMNLAIGPAISPVSIANIPVRSARNPMPAKNWSPRWPAPSSVHRSASCPPSGMPITSARGSRLEVLREDNRAPSSALPVPRPRPPTTFSAFSRSRSSVRKPPTRLTIRRQRDPGSAETQSRTCTFALVRPCGCAE